MVNSFYTASGAPVTSSPGASAVQRSEFALIQAGFDKMPALTANTAIVVNAGGTALGNTVGTLALGGNLSIASAFTVSGAFATTLVAGAVTTIALPLFSGTLATLAGAEELTNKILTASVAKGVWTASGTWTLPAVTLGGAITYGGVTLTNAVTGTGKMVLDTGSTISTLTLTGITTLPGSGQITSAGLLGLGMAPVNIIDVTQTQNASSRIAILNANAGGAANAAFEVLNGTSTAFFYLNGTGFTPAGIDRAGGAVVTTSGPGGLTLATTSNQPIYSYINNILTSRMQNGNGVNCIEYTNAGNATPFGIVMTYSAAAPNGTGNEFLTCTDTGGSRFVARSNGGLANFSANNVNLSDVSAKTDIQLMTPIIPQLWSAHRDVPWCTYKYKDQTHSDPNFGYTAQGIQTAFASVAPALVDQWDAKSGLLAVYSEDLQNISAAVLSEAQRRIEFLESYIKNIEMRLLAAGIK